MSVPTLEPSTIKTIIETLLKPFTVILNPIAERTGNSLKRKPRLHLYVRPLTNFWCYAWDGYGENQKPVMQARFTADITNDGDEGILILEATLKARSRSLRSLIGSRFRQVQRSRVKTSLCSAPQ